MFPGRRTLPLYHLYLSSVGRGERSQGADGHSLLLQENLPCVWLQALLVSSSSAGGGEEQEADSDGDLLGLEAMLSQVGKQSKRAWAKHTEQA